MKNRSFFSKYPFYRDHLGKIMKGPTKKNITITLAVIFAIFYTLSFLAFPDVGEKILYGKHPPGKDIVTMEYSEIILSEDYECMESASLEAKGNLETFVSEFNDCHN